jgi:hypothetical protein
MRYLISITAPVTALVTACAIGLPAPAPTAIKRGDRPSYSGYCGGAALLADSRASWRFPLSYAALSTAAAAAVLAPLAASRIDDGENGALAGTSIALAGGLVGGAGYLLLIAAENNAAAAGGFAECVGLDDARALAVARSVYQRWTQSKISVEELLREVGKLTAGSLPPPPPEPPDDADVGEGIPEPMVVNRR